MNIKNGKRISELEEKMVLDGNDYVPVYDGSEEVTKKTSMNTLVKTAAEVAPKGGWNRKLYEAAGAVYNEKSGFYELNGLKDITEEQMGVIYNVTTQFITKINDCGGAFLGSNIRTNLRDGAEIRYFTSKTTTLNKAFKDCVNLEIVDFKDVDYWVTPIDMNDAFNNCPKLSFIKGIIYAPNISDAKNSFKGCLFLRDVLINGLKIDISFKDSKLISVEDDDKSSLAYAIKNAVNTEPITITLHHDAFVRVPQSLKDKATQKQISIADASAQ